MTLLIFVRSYRVLSEFVIPPIPACRGTGAYPDFLLGDPHQRPRVRLSVKKAA
jgi:hypothetical protein